MSRLVITAAIALRACTVDIVQFEDRNTEDGDGCSATCTVEQGLRRRLRRDLQLPARVFRLGHHLYDRLRQRRGPLRSARLCRQRGVSALLQR